MDIPSTEDPAAETRNQRPVDMNEDIRLGMQHCLECHHRCEQIIMYCLDRGSVYAVPAHIKVFKQCAAVCALTADFMLQRSDFLTRLAAACSELCMACVRICERMSDDPMMEDCAEVCRLAAESCRKLGPYQA